jgi:putative hydrolase of the HAD superfamily
MITTVVFDLDDTLYDEIEYCKSGFMAVADFLAEKSNTFSTECIFDVLWEQFTFGNRKKTFDAALDELGIKHDDEFIEDLVNTYRGHVPNLTLPWDSRDVLCKLGAKYTLALLTDGFLPGQQLKVQSLGIKGFFKCIIYTEELGREFWKPSPAGFEKIIEILDEKPGNMAYIGDNEKKDFIAANKLGFLTVQLIRPARLHTSVCAEIGAKARFVIHEIGRLPALLDEL